MNKHSIEEVTVIGHVTFEDAPTDMSKGIIGVADGKYLVFLFDVGANARAVLPKTPKDKIDPIAQYILDEHMRELVEEDYDIPLISLFAEANEISDEGWEVQYSYQLNATPPKRAILLVPPIDEIEPFELVSRHLTKVREDGALLEMTLAKAYRDYEKE